MKLSFPKIIASLLLAVPGAFFLTLLIDEFSGYVFDFIPMWILSFILIYYSLVNWKKVFSIEPPNETKD